MKRITSIVLLLFFLVGNSSAGVNIHYCGGELQSISLVTKIKSCGMCGMKSSSKKCCKDVQLLIKADDFSKVQTNYSITNPLIEVLPFYSLYNGRFFNSAFHVISTFFSDPPNPKTAIFIRICSLNI